MLPRFHRILRKLGHQDLAILNERRAGNQGRANRRISPRFGQERDMGVSDAFGDTLFRAAALLHRLAIDDPAGDHPEVESMTFAGVI
jgi:hypothetical protein